MKRYAKLGTIHHKPLLRTIGFRRHQRYDHVLSHAQALKQTQCESLETVVRKRILSLPGAVVKTHNGRLRHRVTFGALSGGG